MKYLALMMVAFLGLLGISQAQVMVVYQLSASSIEVGDAFKDDSTPAGSTKRRHYSGVAIHDVASGRVMIVWRTKDKNRKLQETRDYGLNMVNYRPQSADRIMPRDLKRIVRALEVYATTGRTLTDHFSETVSLIADCDVISVALRLPAALTAERVARRVDEQFARGIVEEVRGLLSRGVPADARPFGGLVYRQVMEMIDGVRDEAATRALIAQENRRYARRQLLWFRKEPSLIWFDGPGERHETLIRVEEALAARGLRPRGDAF